MYPYGTNGRRALGVLATCALMLTSPVASAQVKPDSQEESLRRFLRRWARDHNAAARDTRYVRAWVNLRGEGAQQVIVYVEGQSWCGSGGCTMLVLAREGGGFRIVGYSTITHPPIRILAHVTNGWHDIGVSVRGGGVIPGYDAGLPFDGEKYPLNPSVPPARKATGEPVIATVITGEEPGQPLY